MKNEWKGALSLAFCGILYSLYGVYSRFMGSSFSPFYQAWTRSLIVFVILVGFGLLFRVFKPIRKCDLIWFFAVGISGGIIDVLFFIGVNHLAIGMVLFIYYAINTIGNYIWGYVLFHEIINRKKLFSFTLALIGLIILYGDALSKPKIEPLYIIVTIGAGLFASIYLSLSKKISSKYSFLQIAATNNIFGFIATFSGFLLLRENMNSAFTSFPWIINWIYALTQAIIMPLVVFGFKYIEAQKGGLILLLELVFGMIFGIVFFNELPTTLALFASGIILVAMSLPLIQEKQHN